MYSNIISQYLKSLRALRLYVDRTEPITNFRINDHEDLDENSLILIKALWLKERGVDLTKILDNHPEVDLGVKDRIVQIDEYLNLCSDHGKLNSNFMILPKEVKRSYQIVESKEKQNEILYSGSLMLLITYFENLFSKIFYHDFSKYPNRVSLDEKAVTFKTLQDIGNIDEIKEHLIDTEVTKMMYKSFSEWITYLSKSMNLKLKYTNEKKNSILEIISRRNLYVHNDGIVNSIYLNIVSKQDKYKKGDTIRITRDYIDDALNIIECAGISIVMELWLKACSNDEDEIGKMTDLLFDEYLINERWEIARLFYELCLEYRMPAAYELLCKMNKWLCYKKIGEFDKVIDEVNNIDLSAAKTRFMLAKLSLLNKVDEFFELFDKQDEIEEEYLHEWPIFESIRESSIYNERYRENYDKIEQQDKEIPAIERNLEDKHLTDVKEE